MTKLATLSPTGFIADNRSVQNSSVGLTELPPQMTRVSAPQGGLASVGVAAIGDHGTPLPRNFKLESNWLKNSNYGKR